MKRPANPMIADSAQSVVALRTYSAVIDYAARNGWSERLLVDVCKKKFGRVRQGVRILREQYRSMLSVQPNKKSEI